MQTHIRMRTCVQETDKDDKKDTSDVAEEAKEEEDATAEDTDKKPHIKKDGKLDSDCEDKPKTSMDGKDKSQSDKGDAAVEDKSNQNSLNLASFVNIASGLMSAKKASQLWKGGSKNEQQKSELSSRRKGSVRREEESPVSGEAGDKADGEGGLQP